MKHWLPTRAQLRDSRWLRPLARYIDQEHLWRTDRHSVARAVAIGLFFGLLIPVAQFAFAVATAIALRANLAIAAAATLVTNPLTFPPIYYAAYRLGHFILGDPDDAAAAAELEAATAERLGQQGLFDALWASIQSAGAPLMVGLATMAVVGAVLGYGLVWLLWRPRHGARNNNPPDDPPAPPG